MREKDKIHFTELINYVTINSMKKKAVTNYYTLITGATGGVGKAFARNLAAKGNNLYLTGRSEQKLHALQTELLNRFPDITVLTCSCMLTDEISRAAFFRRVETDGVVFDRLCNVAGVDTQKAFVQYTREKIAFQCRVNFEATLCVTHFMLEHRAPNAEIVTISSMSAVYPMPYFAIYSSTKSALCNFFAALRLELKGQGVKITTVLPGGIPTRQDIIADIKGQGVWGKISAKSPDYVAEKSLRAVRRNRKKLIPGFWNRFLATVPKIVPAGMRIRFIARRWKRLEKDAF